MINGAVPGERAAQTGKPATAPRNRYADLLRVGAILAVVYGHWLLTDITYSGGRLSGLDALEYVHWGRWVTLAMQVMPIFFLVGGYANAVSWTAHSGRGESWTNWVRGRAMRLLWPASVYVAVGTLIAGIAVAAGVQPAVLAQAGWFVALHLWFLPVYLLLIALTPVMLAAHRRWGLAVPVAMALGAAGVDGAVLGPHLPVIGYANYLLVWGSMHQWGFAWQDRTLTKDRWRPWVMFGLGLGLLAGLLYWGPFPVDMIGVAGERVINTSPPSIALLAFAAAQTGLVLAAEPAVARLLARPRWWRPVSWLNPKVMTIYLWHMAPVVVVAVAFYPDRLAPQPAIGTAEWWALRPAWFALLTVALVAVVAAVIWAEQPMRLLPTGVGRLGPWSPALLAVGLAAAITGLTKLAISGFAPDGQLPGLVLAAFAGGMLLILLSGHGPRLGGAAAVRPSRPQAAALASHQQAAVLPTRPRAAGGLAGREDPRSADAERHAQ